MKENVRHQSVAPVEFGRLENSVNPFEFLLVKR